MLPWKRPVEATGRHRPLRPYAIAAALFLGVATASLFFYDQVFGPPSGNRAVVQSVTGGFHRLVGQSPERLAPGARLEEGDLVRTSGGGQAVLQLRDGSRVEIGERAEVSVSTGRRDTTLRLERGAIIVQAAKRKSGHLFVASADCKVAVTGTVFSVNAGMKGSRVSVLEGEVRVAHAGRETVLHAGDQVSTGSGMAPVPLKDEIAWSRHIDEHLGLLRELNALRQEWSERVRTPELRYESGLLRRVPEGAVLYAAIPNYGQALGEAHEIFRERLRQSDVLREWWDKTGVDRHEPKLEEVIEKIRTLSDYLGSEVVLFVASRPSDPHPSPVLLAEVTRPGLREFLAQELAELATRGQHGPPVRLVDEADRARPTASQGATKEILIVLGQDMVAVSGDPTALRQVGLAAEGGFATTSLGRRVLESYQDGVAFLFAADLEGMSRMDRRRPREAFASRGQALASRGQAISSRPRHLVFERKSVDGRAQSRAMLSFSGPRRGIASWLAAPAPMGGLDFVSADALGVAAVVSKSPALLLDDIVRMHEAGRQGSHQPLAEVESRLKVRFREDLAATLGGEFVFALDGPLLPTPAWKLVVDVDDPVRLQSTLKTLVSDYNEESARRGRPGLRLEHEQVDGRTYHGIRSSDASVPLAVDYAFVDGYLVAGPNRALVHRAIQIHEGGHTLARSERFAALLPVDRHAHVSGLVYQNLSALVGPLALGMDALNLRPDQRTAIDALVRDAKPSLVCLYGENDHIQLAGTGDLLSFDPSALTLPLLGETIWGTARRANP